MKIHQCVSLVGSQHSSDVFHQEFHVTNATSLPNLLSRDACFRMEILQTCFAVTGKDLPQPEPFINNTTSASKIEETS